MGFLIFLLLLFVWGGRKVLSTNVLHNLYQKQTNKMEESERGRKGERERENSRVILILMAQVITQYVKKSF